MDFGEILAQWDKMQREPKQKPVQNKSGKKANAPSKEEREAKNNISSAESQMKRDFEKTIDPMELWLRRYGVVDKDRLAEESAEFSKMEKIEYLRKKRPDARIDLHGLTRDEAWARLESFVEDSLKRGFQKIEIVHGKGIHSHGSDAVLGKMVKTFIEQNKHLGSSGHPDRNHGGNGVTWVIIK